MNQRVKIISLILTDYLRDSRLVDPTNKSYAFMNDMIDCYQFEVQSRGRMLSRLNGGAVKISAKHGRLNKWLTDG